MHVFRVYMKILLINYEFPPLGGGGGNATLNIAREMAALGYDVTVLTTWFKGLEEMEKKDGYMIIRLKSKRKRADGSNPYEMISFVLTALKRSPSIIRKSKPEKVLAFFAIPSGIVAYYLKKRFNIPYIISLRGGDVPGHVPNQLKYYHLLTKRFIKIILNNAYAIIAVSEYLKRLTEKNISNLNKSIAIIENGINADQFVPDYSKRKDSLIKILFVGRFSEEKRVDMLINSFYNAKIKLPNINIVLDLVGDGVLKNKLKDLVYFLRLHDFVTFSEWCDKNTLIVKYQSAHIFVLPSSYEAMPNVILEAMATGLPIIANKAAGGASELIKNGINGTLFGETNEKLTEAICEIIVDYDLRKKYGEASLSLSKNYSWKNVAQQYHTLLQNGIK